jgi:hypothetical protein
VRGSMLSVLLERKRANKGNSKIGFILDNWGLHQRPVWSSYGLEAALSVARQKRK